MEHNMRLFDSGPGQCHTFAMPLKHVAGTKSLMTPAGISAN